MQSSTNKPRLSFWQLWNMSFGFFGIQFGFALQNTNTSRIFSTLGANADDLALFWLAAPITGLLVQPVIGYLSDNTWHPFWGRRRPFFFVGALLASVAMFLMPNSSMLWMAIAVLWMMDSAINISMEPFRAFVGDKLNPSQQTAGFAMQTFLIGCGGVIASLLPSLLTNYLGVSNVPIDGAIPDTVRYSFYFGGAIFALSVMWTVFTTKEIPPTDLEKFRQERKNSQGFARAVAEILGGFLKMPKTMVQLAWVQFFTWVALFSMWVYTTPSIAEIVFHSTDAQSAAYQEGGNWVGIMFGVYGGVSAIAAFILPILSRMTSRKFVHMICLTIGGVSLVSIFLISSKQMLLLPMVGVGIAWASVLTMPYAILAGALPANRMGYYMGLFNFFVVIPQIVAGFVLGAMLKHLFNYQSVKVLMLGGFCMILAGILTMFVKDVAEQS
ncbi:MFS transporter [Undibacterium sp. 5I1]|uniref:MFS transporter n=1 Tax=unclassified Undibacterium TaxID=2630295 RepID=UPI002AB58992|nr:MULTISPECIES: MFS transporter [unclassified Undibacterium]MDY7539027.1 MFS transporter [Undibacterium sp. 5I1]MEB0229839.1 MFS transporter [Undibacterium sp. 10I3]MEB0259172.1 MFS transporter [Undibacterium sp. 5I1]